MPRYPDIIEAVYECEAPPWLSGNIRFLVEENPVFTHIPWLEANERYGHVYHVRAGNRILRMYCDMGSVPDTAGAFLETLFYGDPSEDPEQFIGLSTMFSTCSPERALCAENVIDAGGDGGSSIWVVAWAPDVVDVRFRKGSVAGFHRGRIEATVCVAEWRHVVRVANISACSREFLVERLKEALFRVRGVPARVYMNARVAGILGEALRVRHTTLAALRDDEPRVT
jgi:hypothetical protein